MKQLPGITWIALSMLASAAAQPGIRPPQLGFAGNQDGTLRPVYGVAGNFILGPPVQGKVISEAFSGSVGLLKTDSTLAAFDGQGRMLAKLNAAAGPAFFAFSPDGLTGVAYVPGSHQLVEWKAGQLVTQLVRTPFPTELGRVVGIALSNTLEATLIVQRENEIWKVAPGSQKALAGVTAPMLALASGELVFRDAAGIVLRKPDGSEIHINGKLPAQFSLQQMDAEWVQLTGLGTATRFAIRVLPGREALYELPEAGQ